MLFCMACSTTTVLQTVSSPVLERRSPVDFGAPVIASQWSVFEDKIVGRVCAGVITRRFEAPNAGVNGTTLPGLT